MVGVICGFGIPHNLPGPRPPSGPGPAPAPMPDTAPTPAQGHRTKYVVVGVTSARTSETETLYTIRLRRSDRSVPPAYIYRVAQKPGAPAPAATNAILDLDPRLVDVEPGA